MANLFGDKPRADNEQDNLDPGQQAFNNTVNGLHKTESRGNYTPTDSDDGSTDEQAGEAPQDSRKDVEKREGVADQSLYNEDPIGKGDRLDGKMNGKRWNKLAPTGLVGLLIAAVGAGTLVAIPSSILVMMERVLTNNGTHDVRANSTMGRARIGGVFSPLRDAACSSSIRCKVASMSSKEITRWSAQSGVHIEEGRSVFGRKIVTSMNIDLPDGKTLKITNAKEFTSALANNEYFRNLNYKVQHPRAAYFISASSKFKSVLKKYKLSLKNPFSTAKPGASKEEQTKAYGADIDKATGAETGGDSESRIKAKIEKVKAKVSATHEALRTSVTNKVAKAVGGPAGLGSIACTLYTVQKATLTTVKISYYTDLMRFFLPFMIAAGEYMEDQKVSPELMTYLGDRLTWYQSAETATTPEEKAKIGLTATDSQGFQAALYGDYGKLTDFTKNYVPWWTLQAAAASDIVKTFENAIGKDKIHDACYASKWLSYLGAANITAIATIGGCKLADIVANDACSKTVMKGFQWIVDQGMDGVYERMENFVLDSDLKGVDLGNAIAAGIGLFLMEKDRGSGLKPATTVAAVNSYLSITNTSYQQDLLAEKEDAKSNPFNTDNQYSFASNLLASLTPYKTSQQTGFSIATNYISVLANSFSSLTNTTTNAGYFQPIESVDNANSLNSMTATGNADGSGRSCQDADMNDSGFLCDWTGRSIDIVGADAIKWAGQMEDGDITSWNDTVDYMENNGYIDKDGSGRPVGYEKYNSNPNPDSYKEDPYENQYLMYKAYCTNDRVYPLGTTMTAPDDDNGNADNMGWFTGAKCGGNDVEGKHIGSDFDNMLNRFFFYYNMCETQLGIADENQKCWEDTPDATPLASLQSDGEWGCPVDPNKGGVMTQGPHDIGNGTASGVDYNYGYNTTGPIYAVRSGVVTQAGPASGYGNWVMIEHDENGKKISSYYGHIAASGILVKVGQQVKKGDHIADIGAGIVGSSTGPHVHAGLKMDPQATPQDYETRFMAACKK